MLNLRKIEKEEVKFRKNGRILQKMKGKKLKNVHRNFIISSRILRNRLINGMEKCLKIEKIHIFQ